jgi:hypothetical protein
LFEKEDAASSKSTFDIFATCLTSLEKNQVLIEKYAKPIQVIAFFDIGATGSIAKPLVLCPHY